MRDFSRHLSGKIHRVDVQGTATADANEIRCAQEGRMVCCTRVFSFFVAGRVAVVIVFDLVRLEKYVLRTRWLAS